MFGQMAALSMAVWIAKRNSFRWIVEPHDCTPPHSAMEDPLSSPQLGVLSASGSWDGGMSDAVKTVQGTVDRLADELRSTRPKVVGGAVDVVHHCGWKPEEDGMVVLWSVLHFLNASSGIYPLLNGACVCLLKNPGWRSIGRHHQFPAGWRRSLSGPGVRKGTHFRNRYQ